MAALSKGFGIRHRATVYGPPTKLGPSGELVGDPVIVAGNVPVEIWRISGTEGPQARTQVADATFGVKMRPFQQQPITPENWLVLDNGERLNVRFVDAYSEPGRTWFLTCGSARDTYEAEPERV